MACATCRSRRRLVAQVDSAYGGKTGVDLEEAKNYVGAFHQPQAVIADPDALDTLPAAELAAGYAEVVKTALIAGGELWERVRGGAAPGDERVIAACALTKLRIVAQDERDSGLRQVLNLGHTVGHAIETVTRLLASTAMARRSGSGCSPRCGSRARTACAPRSPRCWLPRACRWRSRTSTPTPW